jgi:hypothetical protein
MKNDCIYPNGIAVYPPSYCMLRRRAGKVQHYTRTQMLRTKKEEWRKGGFDRFGLDVSISF